MQFARDGMSEHARKLALELEALNVVSNEDSVRQVKNAYI